MKRGGGGFFGVNPLNSFKLRDGGFPFLCRIPLTAGGLRFGIVGPAFLIRVDAEEGLTGRNFLEFLCTLNGGGILLEVDLAGIIGFL